MVLRIHSKAINHPPQSTPPYQKPSSKHQHHLKFLSASKHLPPPIPKTHFELEIISNELPNRPPEQWPGERSEQSPLIGAGDHPSVHPAGQSCRLPLIAPITNS
ncbi:hypothetical protein CEXT_156531 [Caerostris extrusa]|uniref:Uncharacterized protein n=1 Tax=Caerostris extrusa TaxID=172846 RepID=A0AAV4TTV2_CAEEX|nr:hypothetical protein CEXT_156531 [Caerostris extrusa]